MAKYGVGDKVRLTAGYRGQVCIITEVHEGRPVYQYTAQKEKGRGDLIPALQRAYDQSGGRGR